MCLCLLLAATSWRRAVSSIHYPISMRNIGLLPPSRLPSSRRLRRGLTSSARPRDGIVANIFGFSDASFVRGRSSCATVAWREAVSLPSARPEANCKPSGTEDVSRRRRPSRQSRHTSFPLLCCSTWRRPRGKQSACGSATGTAFLISCLLLLRSARIWDVLFSGRALRRHRYPTLQAVSLLDWSGSLGEDD